MNFLKGSLFRRNTEPEELEPMEESGGGILAVWGSPGCGKTVTAVKIAKHLAAQKKNTVLLLCDMTAPMMPCICAPSELEVDKSLGSIFAAQHISVNLIKHNLTTLKRLPHLTMLGLRKKENEYTYAPCTKQQAEELIRGLREIVPYPIVVYCRQLENKQRRITNISECEILPDGSRRLHKLYEYHITDNHLEDDHFIIEGEHRKCEEISESLRRRFIENGMPLGELAQFVQGKEEDE